MNKIQRLQKEVSEAEYLYIHKGNEEARYRLMADLKADERQKLEEYRNILYKLDEVQGNLAYYDKPVKEVSRLHMNSEGRYETAKGHYYTSGSGIEFLRTEEVYNYDTDKWKNAGIWTCSRVESRNGQYYIVGYSDVELSGLKVRVRG